MKRITPLLLLCVACSGPPDPICGDGVLDAGEGCDDGNNEDADGCEADCSLPACGNGIVDPGEVCLSEAQILVTDSLPKEALLDDFNGDGVLDIAVATSGGRALDVFLGLEGGAFEEQRIITPLTSFGSSLASGDFNGDGVLDIAVLLDDADTIAPFLGQGNGTFLAAATLPTAQNPFNLVVGDFDNDGELDLVTGADNPGTLHLFSGLGNGSFTDDSITLLNNPAGLAAGDLNNDGKLDLIATFPGQDAILPLIQSTGSFELRPAVTVSDGPLSVTVADLNGDEAPDLAVGHLGEVRTFFGDGAGGFTEEQAISTEGTNFFLDSGDVNNDGRSDIVTTSGLPSELVLLVSQENGELVEFGVPLSVEGAFMARLAELNGDGVLDAVVTTDFDRVVVFLSEP